MAPFVLHWHSWDLIDFISFIYLFFFFNSLNTMYMSWAFQMVPGMLLQNFQCCISLPWCVVDGFIPINKFEIYQFQRHCWEYCQFQPVYVCLFIFSYPHIHWRVLKGLVRVHVWKAEIDGCLYFEKLQANLHTASPYHRYLWFQLKLLSWAIPLLLPTLLAYGRCQASQLWISATFVHQWQECYPHSLHVM